MPRQVRQWQTDGRTTRACELDIEVSYRARSSYLIFPPAGRTPTLLLSEVAFSRRRSPGILCVTDAAILRRSKLLTSIVRGGGETFLVIPYLRISRDRAESADLSIPVDFSEIARDSVR